MGACKSKNSRRKYMPELAPFIPPPIDSEKCTFQQKTKMAEAIKKNDIILVSRLLTFIKPTENLHTNGAQYTCLHYAAQHNANRVMCLFIEFLRKQYSDKEILKMILNIEEKQMKRTPAMICAMNNSAETLYFLLRTELVDQRVLDKERKDLWMLCEMHSKVCHIMIKLSQNRKDFSDPVKIFNKLNKELFALENKLKKPNPRKGNSMSMTDFEVTFSNKKPQEENEGMVMTSFRSKGLIPPYNMELWLKKDHLKPLDEWWTFDEYGDKLKPNDKEVLSHIPTETRLFEAMVEVLQKNTEVYEDPEFPHNDDAMGTLRLKNIVWCRPDELFQVPLERLYLFDSIEFKNIKMGEKNTCFLLSCLTSLAEYPERLVKIFMNKRVNYYGCYGIKLYLRGRPTEVIFDDYFPCKLIDGLPISIFSNPGGIEIWLVLLEKAWAKLFGAYSAIEFAMSSEVWEIMLGIPTIVHQVDGMEEDILWRRIMEADRSNFYLTAATRENAKEKGGLISTHSYTMISAFEINEHKIIKMRNNWDPYNRDRDYSDTSPLWGDTNELRAQVGWMSTRDGVFFISFKDFRTYFTEVMIGHVYNTWHYSSVDCKSTSNHAEYFTFSVKEPTHAYLRVHQRNERFTDSGYSPVEFNVYMYDNQNFRLFAPLNGTKGDTDPNCLTGNFSVFPNKNGLMQFKPGDYVCRVKIIWKNQGQHPFTISAYSENPIELEHSQERLKNVRARVAVHMGMFSEVERLDQGNSCVIARMWTDSDHLIYAENSGEQRWILTITFPKQVNAKPFKPYRTSEDTITITLDPGMRNGTGNKIINRLLPTEIMPEFSSEWEDYVPEPEFRGFEKKTTGLFEKKNTITYEKKKSVVSFA
jgi:Calpain family cysteine protease